MSHAEHWRLPPAAGHAADRPDPQPGRADGGADRDREHTPTERNVSLISCGGQASIPIAHALASRFEVEYIEVVSTVASSIAGRATRLNLDEYVATTQHAITRFSGVRDTKAILNISPAVPPATFRTAVHAIIPGAAAEAVRAVVADAAAQVRAFAPGYEVIACTVTGDRVFVSLEVTRTATCCPGTPGTSTSSTRPRSWSPSSTRPGSAWPPGWGRPMSAVMIHDPTLRDGQHAVATSSAWRRCEDTRRRPTRPGFRWWRWATATAWAPPPSRWDGPPSATT